jgi:hypothetical protein
VELQQIEEQPISVEELKKELKDEIPSGIDQAIKRHNTIIEMVNGYEKDMDSLTPFQLAKLEHCYNKLEREAWKITGYYKSQYQFYFGRASTERGKFYIYERETNKCQVNDSNYKSKVQEGINQEISGIYEGYFVTWKGIAQSYANMQNALKDMIKAVGVEGGN